MRTLFFFCLLFLLANFSKSQVKLKFNFSMTVDTLKVRKFVFDKRALDLDVKTLNVPFNFNDDKIFNRELLDSLNDGLTEVIGIDYVYTQYRDAKTQDELNKKRLFELYLVAPNLLNQSMTKWRFIEQLGFTKDEDAKLLYHGFIVKYIRITPYLTQNPTIIKNDIMKRMESPHDSLILKVFDRNPNMKKDVIISDFTGSMSPYYLELLAWFCLQELKTESSFTFFNDGDGKSDDLKLIGNTGGIHQFKSKNLDTIVKYVAETIGLGSGGDCPENDIEAILKAIEKNPNCGEVILIADNWSDMRDYNLRGRVLKPVHVILCGTNHGINLQYLNLALETKGSIHTMNEDLNKLFEMKEGATFTLNKETYVVRGHRIEKLLKL